MRKRNLILAIILLAISIGTLVEIKKEELPIGQLGSPGPGFFPLVVVTLLGIFSLILLVQTIKGGDEEKAPPWVNPGGWFPLGVTVGILFAYVFVYEFLGAIISTFVLMLFLVGAFGKKRWWFVLMVAFLTTLFSHILFVVLLNTPLPLGILAGILKGY